MHRSNVLKNERCSNGVVSASVPKCRNGNASDLPSDERPHTQGHLPGPAREEAVRDEAADDLRVAAVVMPRLASGGIPELPHVDQGVLMCGVQGTTRGGR